MKSFLRIAMVALASALVGCDRQEPRAVSVVETTNVVDQIREVVVTNRVVVTVTNVVVESRAPERVLSSRKTAPYEVSSTEADEAKLRQLLSTFGVRVVSCRKGSVALVEATDKMVGLIEGVVPIRPLTVADKVARDVGERVRVVPLSSIDAAAVAKAIREAGGKIVQVVTVGSPCIRAEISEQGVKKIAARGDVRRIERDER